MKLLHIADLHIGKRVCEYAMLEDQRHILREICDLARSEAVDAVLVAGDVYDRPVPSEEATALLSDFLCELSARGIRVLMIAGNHDSAERLDFCSPLLSKGGVHITGSCEGESELVVLEKDEVRVAVHLLSFTKPAALRRVMPEASENSEQMFRALVAKADLTAAPYNLLLAHAFVTGAASCDSEQVVVGTVDNVPAEVFAPFDYVAMGHLHRPQCIGNACYAGSPLAYSFSEAGDAKSVRIIEIGEGVRSRTVPLHPLRAMREVRGGMSELLSMPYSEDYIRAVVTDEDVAPDARVTLRTVFPNLMRFAVENSHTATDEVVEASEHLERRDPLELFAEFYEQQNGRPADESRLAVMRTLLQEVLP